MARYALRRRRQIAPSQRRRNAQELASAAGRWHFAVCSKSARLVPAAIAAAALVSMCQVLAQNEKFKVISVVWRRGQRDLLHSHPTNAVYSLGDCSICIYASGGTFRDAQIKAGSAVVQAPIRGTERR